MRNEKKIGTGDRGTNYDTTFGMYPDISCRKPHFLLLCAVLLMALALASCDTPGPLFGTWADNKGNSLTFNPDNTFSAKITYGVDEILNDSGQFSLLQNSLTLKCEEKTIVTEWDIRGNILYLNWLTTEGTILLTLFKIAN